MAVPTATVFSANMNDRTARKQRRRVCAFCKNANALWLSRREHPNATGSSPRHKWLQPSRAKLYRHQAATSTKPNWVIAGPDQGIDTEPKRSVSPASKYCNHEIYYARPKVEPMTSTYYHVQRWLAGHASNKCHCSNSDKVHNNAKRYKCN